MSPGRSWCAIGSSAPWPKDRQDGHRLVVGEAPFCVWGGPRNMRRRAPAPSIFFVVLCQSTNACTASHPSPPLHVAMATSCALGLGTWNAQWTHVNSALPKPREPAGVLGGHGNHLGGWYFCCRKQVAVTSAHRHTPQTHRHHDRPCRRCRPDPSEGAHQEMDPYKPKYSATCGPPQLTLLQFPGSMCTLSAGSAGRAHGTGGVLVAEFSSKIPSQRGFAPCCLGIDRARTPTSR